MSMEQSEHTVQPQDSIRKIIFHYHLFKNAGTSLDGAFKRALLPDQWLTREFSAAPIQNQKGVKEWISTNHNAICFSSHTAELPAPHVDGVEIFPIIFIRHPIDRIASAYTFESKQDASTFGSTLARNTNLAGYIETRLSLTVDYQCRDFQARRLAAVSTDKGLSLMERAKIAIDELPFIGLVEKYDLSLAELNRQLDNFGFTDIELVNETLNVNRSHNFSIEQKLETIRKDLGDELYSELENCNSCDLEIYDLIVQRYTQDDMAAR